MPGRIVRIGRKRKYTFRFSDGNTGVLFVQPSTTTVSAAIYSLPTNHPSIHAVDAMAEASSGYGLHTFNFNSCLHFQEFDRDRITTEFKPSSSTTTRWKVRRQFQDVQGTLDGTAISSSQSKSRGIVDFMFCCASLPIYDSAYTISFSKHEGIVADESKEDVALEREYARTSHPRG